MRGDDKKSDADNRQQQKEAKCQIVDVHHRSAPPGPLRSAPFTLALRSLCLTPAILKLHFVPRDQHAGDAGCADQHCDRLEWSRREDQDQQNPPAVPLQWDGVRRASLYDGGIARLVHGR